MTHQITTPTATHEDEVVFDFNFASLGVTVEVATAPESSEAAMARITHSQEREARETDE